MTQPIDTASAPRRQLRFASTDEALADVERIEAAEREGRLKRTGNWTAGQIFGHVAAWCNFAYEGFPLAAPPWVVRVVLKRYLRNGMPAGVRIPSVENGTVAFEPLDTAEGARRLREAFTRLASDEPAPHDSPAFGPLSHAERIQLNLRHAELHLGFLEY